jgi:transcriptional regulator with XRE-family HTH domain
MGRRKPSTYHIRQLSRALAVRRLATGLTQVEVAQKIGICDKKLSRIETGQLPELIVLRAQLDLYGLLFEECQAH